MMPSMANTLSSLLSFSWPPRSSSFPLVITILVANVFIFLSRLTEKSIRRQVGGAQGTQQSHSPARVRGAGARGRRGEGGERGCRGFLPHSPKQRRPTGRLRLRLAAGHRNPIMLFMSLSATGEVCARLGCLQATPRGSSCPTPGLGGKISEGGWRCGEWCGPAWEEKGAATSGSPQGRGNSAVAIATLKASREGTENQLKGLQAPIGECQCVPRPSAQMLTTRAGFPGPGLRS